MQLADLAHAILFGDRWEDKLLSASSLEDARPKPALIEVPSFPGRPPRLTHIGRTQFPAPETLKEEAVRGRLLHFFANHELLAMELMALMLLKFPDAPKAFRMGIAGTIAEEQNHLRLYTQRMNELGVGFGELPVSDYFWNLMRGMASPLEFVTQMSLTLEQANLDFSLFYQRAAAAAGDDKTAAILERVYREEIGHVKHGLHWFNVWRRSSAPTKNEDDWDAYLRLLPPPLNARRAKGSQFFAEPRRQAGFSERFTRELEVFSGSKGRPPVFWLFNPLCDAEIARGKPGHTAPATIKRLEHDLGTVPLFLALETDVCLVAELPRVEFLKSLQSLGFRTPEFRRLGPTTDLPRETKIAGIEPWGWSPEPLERFRSWRDRLIPIGGANAAWCGPLLNHANFAETGLAPLFSKAWSTGYLRDWLDAHPEAQTRFGSLEWTGAYFSDWAKARERVEAAFAQGTPIVAKAPWGASGTQNKRILDLTELESTTGGWLRNTIETQGGIVLEPWLDKVVDLSMQIEVTDEETRVIGVRHFVNGSRSEYRGTYLDPKLRSVPLEVLRFLHSGDSPLDLWQTFAQTLGATLRENGYRGPAGLDALVWRDGATLRLKPLVELNPRWTMGRVALEIETHVAPGVPAAWIFIPVRDSGDVKALVNRHPPKTVQTGAKLRIEEGLVFTTDAERAQSVFTVLAVGKTALKELGWAEQEV